MPENCHQQLHSVPGLAKRMANLMDLIERPCTPPTPLDDSFDSDDPVVAVTNGTSEIVDSSSSSNNTDGDNEDNEEVEGAGCVLYCSHFINMLKSNPCLAVCVISLMSQALL